jgi:Rod binding domain-containing protein
MAAALSPATVPPTLLKPVPAIDVNRAPTAAAGEAGPPLASDAARAKARDVAERFEGQFLGTMLQYMFQGVSTDGPFGGGFGEEMFRSVMTDAMAKQMTRAGGIGLSDTIQREILKMQGLK